VCAAAAVIRQIQCDFSLESLFCVIYQARGHLGNPRAAKKTQTLERFQFSNSSLHTSQRFVHVYENLRMRLSSPSALLLYLISHLSLYVCVLSAQLLLCFLSVYSCVVKRATSRQKSKAQARSCFADFTFSVPIGFIFGTEKSAIYVCYTAAAILSFILSFVFFLQDNQIFTMKSKISQQNNSGAFMNAVLYILKQRSFVFLGLIFARKTFKRKCDRNWLDDRA
jgi:RNase P protein component